MLKTQRLILRPAQFPEAETIAEYHRRNREFHQPWEPTRPDIYFTPLYWQKQLQVWRKEWEQDKTYAFFLFHEDKPVGRFAFTNLVRGSFQAAHLGFSLAQEVQGRGFMQEALEEGLAFAFERLQLNRVMANYRPHNKRSARLLERLGFEVEGQARGYLFIDGAWRDHVLTSKLNPEPPQPF